MPDKDGDDDKKTTKEVVNKKQKQMMNKEEYTIEMVRKIKKKISARAVFPTVAQNKIRNEIIKGDDLKIDNKNPVKKKLQKKNLDEEGYDVARDQGRVSPSKDKKDATSLPVSDEVKKTQKKNKGPSALERVKADIEKKYGKGAIMKTKKEELDLTQVAEAFGGYIIEAKKLNNKRYDLQEVKKKFQTPPDPWDDNNTKTENNKKGPRNIKKKTGNKNKKLDQDLNQRRTAQDRQQQLYNRQYDAYDDGDMGNPNDSKGYEGRTNPDQLKIPKLDTSKKATATTDKPKRKYYKATKKSSKATPKELERTKKLVAKADAKEKAKMYKSPETGRMKRRTKSYRDTSIGIADRKIKVAAQKTKQFAAQSAKTAKTVATKAVATAKTAPLTTGAGAVVIAGTVRDMFRDVKIPTPPKVRGGTVGRRTAG